MNAFCLGSEQIDDLWGEIGPYLEKFERTIGVETALGIREDLKCERKQLWGLQDPKIVYVALTRIVKQPRGMLCEICGMVATQNTSLSRKHMHALLGEIESWAKSIGCTRMNVSGRKGWKRFLDYAEVGAIYEKEI